MKAVVIQSLLFVLLLAGCASKGVAVKDTKGVVVRDMTGGGVVLPEGGTRRIVSMVAPEYPSHLRQKKVTGDVIVRIWVRVDGSVAKASAQSSPNPELARLAEDAVLQWRFEPTLVNPSMLLVLQLPIEFSIMEDDLNE